MIDSQPGKAVETLWVKTGIGDNGDTVRLVFSGRALEYARKIARARTNILVGVTVEQPDEEYHLYQSVDFPAAGSKAAINSAIAGCGLD